MKQIHDIFNEMQVFFLSVTLKGIIQYANSYTLDYLDYSKDEVINKPISDFLAIENINKLKEVLENTENMKLISENVQLASKNYSRDDLLLNIKLCDKNFKSIIFYEDPYSKKNISSSKEDIEISKDRMNIALANSKIVIYDYDFEKEKYYHSSGINNLLEIENISSNKISDFFYSKIHKEDKEKTIILMNSCKNNKTDIFDHEYRLKKQDGEYIWVHDKGKVIKRDKDGNVIRFIGTITDINELKRKNEELRRRNVFLELNSRVKEFFPKKISENALLNVISKTIYEYAEYKYVMFFRIIPKSDDLKVKIESSYGLDKKIFPKKCFSLSRSDYKVCPIVKSIIDETEVAMTIDEIDQNNLFFNKKNFDFNSFISLPVISQIDNFKFGTFVILSQNKNIDNEELKMLKDISNNVGLKLQSIRKNIEVEESLRMLEKAANHFPGPFYILDDNMKPVFFNEKCSEYSNFSKNYFENNFESIKENNEKALEQGNLEYEEDIIDKSNNTKRLYTYKFKINRKNERDLLFSMSVDLTEKHKALKEISDNQNIFIETLAKIVEIRDPYTAGHQKRVSELSVEIAKKLGLEKSKIKSIKKAGLLHDIGKINVPAEILNKSFKLTSVEYSLVKDHTIKSYELLKKLKFKDPVAEYALQHHERIDGSGYPYGLKGDKMHLESKILAVADVVEAMMSHRPYRPALGLEKALEEIQREAGRLYDPTVVSACLELFYEGFKFDK